MSIPVQMSAIGHDECRSNNFIRFILPFSTGRMKSSSSSKNDKNQSSETNGCFHCAPPNPRKLFHSEAYCGCSEHSETISLPNSPFPPEMHFKRERRKTIIVFIFFLTIIVLNHLILAIVSDIISRDPLPDLMHSMFGQSSLTRHVADVLAFCGVVSTFFLVCILHKYRWIVSRRLFYIASILYLMRAISINVTHIPAGYSNNHELCVPPSEEANTSFMFVLKNFLHIFRKMGLQVTDDKGRMFCGDMLFSGHTTAISLSCFFLNYYLPHSLWPLKLAVGSICCLAMACLVNARAHYSVDVIMGYWICSITFSLYHAFCEVPHKTRHRARSFRRLLLFWSMYEMERRVPSGRLPNQLEWPLPWPQCAIDFLDNWNEQTTTTRSGRTARWLAEHRIKLHM